MPELPEVESVRRELAPILEGVTRRARPSATKQPAAPVSAGVRSPDHRHDRAAADPPRQVPARGAVLARHVDHASRDVGILPRRAVGSRARVSRSRRLRSVVGPGGRLQRPAAVRRHGSGPHRRPGAIGGGRRPRAGAVVGRVRRGGARQSVRRDRDGRSKWRCSISRWSPASATSTPARRCTWRGCRRGCRRRRSRRPAGRRNQRRDGSRPRSKRCSSAPSISSRAPGAVRQHDGDDAQRFRVYDHAGERCPRRGCRGRIRRITQAGRATFYCPVCQRYWGLSRRGLWRRRGSPRSRRADDRCLPPRSPARAGGSHGSCGEVRASRLRVHGRERPAVRQVLQRALQGIRAPDDAELPLHAPGVPAPGSDDHRPSGT